jgi:hypothetical protein
MMQARWMSVNFVCSTERDLAIAGWLVMNNTRNTKLGRADIQEARSGEKLKDEYENRTIEFLAKKKSGGEKCDRKGKIWIHEAPVSMLLLPLKKKLLQIN